MFIETAARRGTALVAGALVLAACGGVPAVQDASVLPNATTSAQPTADFNDADVMFAQMMSVHHRQAVEMAEMAATRASSAQVKDLAAEIRTTQQREIATMRQWLKAWGKPEPTAGMGHEMPGAMSEADMNRLEAAEGTAFDREFLRLMIRHHEGAIAMARTEQREGENPQAKQLAGAMVTDQQDQVDQMREMLDRLR
ncbi:DUF305 domain-containing protein [Nonomuraea aridisoli]|uniref:DUF305 domain-containing protein n=1 Tax=Nonomuraea aridisoli TaxID=2070368 RepID=A0A2W2EU53_9ACTN|nr:DUF305 domain-containing protein [Nonomuraea aridisoli]PZG15978.1 DUF305 domain-containing protein [Nonomuraea aridisoli]